MANDSPESVFDLVTEGQALYQQFATSAFDQAAILLQDLTQYAVEFTPANVSFEAPDFGAFDFTAPDEPEIPPSDVNIGNLPSLPDLPPAGAIQINQSPVFQAQAPSINFPSPPSPLQAVAPGSAPDIPDIEFPDPPAPLSASPPDNFPDVTTPVFPTAPDVSIPQEPTFLLELPVLRELRIPEIREPDFPEFSAIPPDFTLNAPVPAITFENQAYSSAQLTALQQGLARLSEGIGLPASAEAALYERARSRADRNARKEEHRAFEQWSSRGFDEPGGELAARVAEIHQGNQDALGNLNRDVYVQSQQTAIENVRFALGQMNNLEASLIRLFSEAAGRSLEAQQIAGQLAIDQFNAQVALVNLRQAQFRTEADVFRVSVDAERAKLDADRIRIEAALAVNQINELDVRIYGEQIRAFQAEAGIYETRVRAVQNAVSIYEAQVRAEASRAEVDRIRMDGFRARIEAYAAQVQAKRTEFESYGERIRAEASKADVSRIRVDGFRAEVDSFSAQVGAKRAENEAYAEQVRAESTKAAIFQTQAGAYASQVQAYAASVDAAIAPVRAQVDVNRQKVETFQAQLAAYREGVNAEVARHQARLSIYEGQARIYGNKVTLEQARVSSAAQSIQLLLESARTQTSFLLENSRLNTDNGQRAAALAIEKLRSAATVAAQLAAGAMSAVNLSAGISGSSSSSLSRGQSLGVSYTVDGGEASPPDIPVFT